MQFNFKRDPKFTSDPNSIIQVNSPWFTISSVPLVPFLLLPYSQTLLMLQILGNSIWWYHETMHSNHMVLMVVNRTIMRFCNWVPLWRKEIQGNYIDALSSGLDWRSWQRCNSAWHLSITSWPLCSKKHRFDFYDSQRLPLPLSTILMPHWGFTSMMRRILKEPPILIFSSTSLKSMSFPNECFFQCKKKNARLNSCWHPCLCHEKMPWFLRE